MTGSFENKIVSNSEADPNTVEYKDIYVEISNLIVHSKLFLLTMDNQQKNTMTYQSQW